MKKIVFISIAVVLLVIASVVGYMSYEIFGRAVHRDTVVYIPTGSDSESIISVLDTVTSRPRFLSLASRVAADRYGAPNAGKFTIKEGSSNYDMLRYIYTSRGEEVKVTYNSLRRLEDLAGVISRQIEADSLSIITAIRDTSFLSSNAYDINTVMSLFIPDTYHFYWNTSAQQFLDRCVKEYKRFWNEERLKKAEAMGMTPLQVTTLASIVESETVKVDEQSRVAGLYVNRLKKGILLQSDPTVIYAILQVNPERYPIRRVYFSDLKIDSPYNTYRNSGLPPSPIRIPSRGAIEATLNYEHNSYIYMCASPERVGYHAFARNLSEHNKNRRAYIRWINSRNIK
ncbi:MAG: endolytic transglycosylase MltG [Flavobacteriales bacterium]|nr:endolytic transglycosylase MltG [Flavobacteriales bacterium]